MINDFTFPLQIEIRPRYRISIFIIEKRSQLNDRHLLSIFEIKSEFVN